jgi:hypothetical protein
MEPYSLIVAFENLSISTILSVRLLERFYHHDWNPQYSCRGRISPYYSHRSQYLERWNLQDEPEMNGPTIMGCAKPNRMNPENGNYRF